MADFDFRGMGVALITPFDDNGDVDYRCLTALVERIINASADYIVVLGTTAETPTLNKNERLRIRQTVVDATSGRVPLVLGFGGNCTSDLCAELEEWDGAGFCAILSVTPFYNKPSQRGLYEHFKAIAEASPLPVILYNVPGRTGVNMEAQTTLRLAREVPGITGIKEASGNMQQIAEILASAPEDFAVISGDDGLTVEMTLLGGRGVISVIGNAAPSCWGRLTSLALKGDRQSAIALEEKMRPLLEMLFEQGNPAGIKALMAELGLCGGTLRLPLVEVDDTLKTRMRDFISAYPNIG